MSKLNVPSELGRFDNVKNSCGVASNRIDDLSRLRRFLIIGSSKSYYASEQQLTLENSKNILELIKEPSLGRQAVDTIVEVSVGGKAPKNGPALFALAMACSKAPEEIRKYAFGKLNDVARIPTDLFQFVEYAWKMRGWGHQLKSGVRNWYDKLTPDRLSYLVCKYQQRDGMTHKRLFDLCHPKWKGTVKGDIKHWVHSGWESVGEEPHPDEALRYIWAFERAKKASSVEEIVRLIVDYNLVRECIPTTWLDKVEVWEALLQKMPMTAMLRNLATMTKVGLLKDFSDASKMIISRLRSIEALKKARIHPMNILVALKTYASGRGLRGSNTWVPVQSVNNALDDAFYLAFDAVEPTGLNTMVSVDVSGSMDGSGVANLPLNAREVAACMAMVVARTEPNHVINGFSGTLVNIPIHTKMRLDEVITTMRRIPMGSTNAAAPILKVIQENLLVDTFVVITDNEHNTGNVTPAQAMKNYRSKTGRGKLAVLACQPTYWTVADPNDPNMMDFVGFSTDTPVVLNEFVRGNI